MGSASEITCLLPDTASTACIRYLPKPTTTYSQLCNDLIDTIQSLSKNHTVQLLGYSMGGRLAYSILPMISDLVQKVTFISSGLPLITPKDRYLKYRFEQFSIQQSLQLSSVDFCRWWYSLPLYSTLPLRSDFDAFIQQRANQFNCDLFSLIIKQFSALAMPFTHKHNASPYPLLSYIYGEHDTKYELISKKMARQFKSVQTHSIKGASHLCWYESPKEMASILIEK